jgi:hypothetical protein
VKKFNRTLLSLSFIALFSTAFYSCKKINEATELGSDLIPVVDNINTFETTLETETNNRFNFTDDTRIFYSDNVALGAITSDPEFGKTETSVYFNLNPATFVYPFSKKEDVIGIDSVVLTLGYKGAYGDTTASSIASAVRVYEVPQNSDFSDSSSYLISRDPFPVGTQIGAATFNPITLKDSVKLIRKRDTIKVANVLRIRLNNSFGNRLVNLDSTDYKTYSNFYNAIKGIGIKSESVGNTLSYFSLNDPIKSRLVVYYRVQKAGVIDTTSADFFFGPSGTPNHGTVANLIRRTPEGGFATYLNNGSPSDEILYIQSAPGSIANIRIPGLDNLSNRIIHRAELIITKLPSLNEVLFPPPPALFLDKASLLDSAFAITDDLLSATQTGPSFTNFGGLLRPDNTYRFNITRHVQNIVTSKQTNYQLRLYAPLRTTQLIGPTPRIISILPQIAYGRVVLAGGNYTADASKRVRLRIVYSNIQ